MSVTVTCRDDQTGEESTEVVQDGDYLIVTVEPCHLAYTRAYPRTGTHIVTLRGRIVR